MNIIASNVIVDVLIKDVRLCVIICVYKLYSYRLLDGTVYGCTIAVLCFLDALV